MMFGRSNSEVADRFDNFLQRFLNFSDQLKQLMEEGQEHPSPENLFKRQALVEEFILSFASFIERCRPAIRRILSSRLSRTLFGSLFSED